MLYKDNEYINECNYKIHYDCLENTGAPSELILSGSNNAVCKDSFYDNIENAEYYNKVKLYIIKTNNTISIKSDGGHGTVIRKMAPNLYKYIKIIAQNTNNT